MMAVTSAQIVKATKAVMNHPPITDSIPVIRYTALSRPQARSASEEPIATIKVTYVVESGNFIVVPIMINKPESTRLTAARTISNAAPFSRITSSLLKRLSIQRRIPTGITFTMNSLIVVARRTMVRARADEPNISSPSS